jgi:hypothetical protein
VNRGFPATTNFAHRAPALALEAAQETDPIFRTPPQSVCKNQGRLARQWHFCLDGNWVHSEVDSINVCLDRNSERYVESIFLESTNWDEAVCEGGSLTDSSGTIRVNGLPLTSIVSHPMIKSHDHHPRQGFRVPQSRGYSNACSS